MSNPEDVAQTPAPEQAQSGDQVKQEAMDYRTQALADIDKARQNLAEGTGHPVDGSQVVLTPREANAVSNGETDAK